MQTMMPSVPFSMAPYPAVRLLVTIMAGILAGVNFALPLQIWIICCALSFTALLGALLHEKIACKGLFPIFFTVLSYSLFVLFCFAAYGSYRLYYVPQEALLRFSGKTVLLYGCVDGRPDISEKGVSWIMDVEEVFEKGRRVKFHDRVKVFLRSPGSPVIDIHNGDMLRVKGKLDLVPEAVNRGEFNPRIASRMQQVSVQLYCAGPWLVQREGESRGNLFEHFIQVSTVCDKVFLSVN